MKNFSIFVFYAIEFSNYLCSKKKKQQQQQQQQQTNLKNKNKHSKYERLFSYTHCFDFFFFEHIRVCIEFACYLCAAHICKNFSSLFPLATRFENEKNEENYEMLVLIRANSLILFIDNDNNMEKLYVLN
jgi:hypothetical protein